MSYRGITRTNKIGITVGDIYMLILQQNLIEIPSEEKLDEVLDLLVTEGIMIELTNGPYQK
jgi:hypothetical protein